MAFKFDFGGDGAATVSGGGDGFKFNFGGDEDEGGKSEDGKAFDFDEYRNTPDGMVKARSLTSAAIRYISVACVPISLLPLDATAAGISSAVSFCQNWEQSHCSHGKGSLIPAGELGC